LKLAKNGVSYRVYPRLKEPALFRREPKGSAIATLHKRHHILILYPCCLPANLFYYYIYCQFVQVWYSNHGRYCSFFDRTIPYTYSTSTSTSSIKSSALVDISACRRCWRYLEWYVSFHLWKI